MTDAVFYLVAMGRIVSTTALDAGAETSGMGDDIGPEFGFLLSPDPVNFDDHYVTGSPPAIAERPDSTIAYGATSAPINTTVTFSNVTQDTRIQVVDGNGTAEYVMDASGIFEWEATVVTTASITFVNFPDKDLTVIVSAN